MRDCFGCPVPLPSPVPRSCGRTTSFYALVSFECEFPEAFPLSAPSFSAKASLVGLFPPSPLLRFEFLPSTPFLSFQWTNTLLLWPGSADQIKGSIPLSLSLLLRGIFFFFCRDHFDLSPPKCTCRPFYDRCVFRWSKFCAMDEASWESSPTHLLLAPIRRLLFLPMEVRTEVDCIPDPPLCPLPQ